MFTDSATIEVKGGDGGKGTVAWRREKYVAKGGPNGGDGGHGGSVYFTASPHADTLSNYASKKHYQAPNGKPGGGQDKHGKNGDDLFLPVPVGTLVYELFADGSKDLVADLHTKDQTALVCQGGRGGYGNAHFVSAVRQRPDFAELGEAGEEKQLQLELKLVADVGIIGYPSVGKSSIITAISAAKPKVADYEFTTLVPNLGVVDYDNNQYIVCDVPGLIEGAADGKGLGHTFLKHIERCRILLHTLSIERGLRDDGSVAQSLQEDYLAIRKELERYSEVLASKPEYIVLNKSDLLTKAELTELTVELKALGLNIWQCFSTFVKEDMDTLKKKLLTVVEKHKTESVVAEEPTEEVVLNPLQEKAGMRNYTLEADDSKVVITGKRLEQLVAMTDFNQPGAVKRLNNVLERIGILKQLKKHEGKQVLIGKVDVSEVVSNVQ